MPDDSQTDVQQILAAITSLQASLDDEVKEMKEEYGPLHGILVIQSESIRKDITLLRGKIRESEPKDREQLDDVMTGLELSWDRYDAAFREVSDRIKDRERRQADEVTSIVAKSFQKAESISDTLLRYLVIAHGAISVTCIGVLGTAWTSPKFVLVLSNILVAAGIGVLISGVGLLFQSFVFLGVGYSGRLIIDQIFDHKKQDEKKERRLWVSTLIFRFFADLAALASVILLMYMLFNGVIEIRAIVEPNVIGGTGS